MPTPPPVATNREPSSTPSSDHTRTMPPSPPAPAVSWRTGTVAARRLDALQRADVPGDDVDRAAAAAGREPRMTPAPGSPAAAAEGGDALGERERAVGRAQQRLAGVAAHEPGQARRRARASAAGAVGLHRARRPSGRRSESSRTGPPLPPRPPPVPPVVAHRRGVDVGGGDVDRAAAVAGAEAAAGAAAEAERADVEPARQAPDERAAAAAGRVGRAAGAGAAVARDGADRRVVREQVEAGGVAAAQPAVRAAEADACRRSACCRRAGRARRRRWRSRSRRRRVPLASTPFCTWRSPNATSRRATGRAAGRRARGCRR